MPVDLVALVGLPLVKGAIKGVAAAASKHIYDKGVKNYSNKKSQRHSTQTQQQVNYAQPSPMNYMYSIVSCDVCGRIISDGSLYHCSECSGLDFCGDCYMIYHQVANR